jgi:hypothetical protein
MVYVTTHLSGIGWDTVVAVATLGLAIGTGVLALATWRLAQQTTAEVQALSRPIIKLTDGELSAAGFSAQVTNVGAGVALNVRLLEPEGFGYMGRSLSGEVNDPLVLGPRESGEWTLPSPRLWAGDVTQDIMFDIVVYCEDAANQQHYVVINCRSLKAAEYDAMFNVVPTSSVKFLAHNLVGATSPHTHSFHGVFQYSTGEKS